MTSQAFSRPRSRLSLGIACAYDVSGTQRSAVTIVLPVKACGAMPTTVK